MDGLEVTTPIEDQCKQTKHVIPIEKSSPVLISNGAEQVIQHQLSKDFAVVAKEDGTILEINNDTGIVIIQYKSGKKEAFDISPKTVKNGAGGFYLSNKLICHFKQGDKVKQNQVIASDDKFFSHTQDGNKFNIGSLQKIAVMGAYLTYEDSTFITNKLAQEMASDIIMPREIVLAKSANVENLVKIGDKVRVGDELLSFENASDDGSLNELLASVGEDLQESIKSLGKKPITSKYTGEVVDIKIYTTCELDELSPSLKKVVKDYYSKINKKKAVLDKHDKSNDPFKLDFMMTEPTNKVVTKDGKVKGNQVDEGVLIQIFIKYRDVMGVGDKLAK